MTRGVPAIVAACLVGPLLAWWLFADTIAYYSAERGDRRAIRFTFFGGIDDQRMWREIAGEFERQNPQSAVRLEFLPISGYSIKISQQFAAGDAPDLMLYQDEPFPRVAPRAFADIPSLLPRDSSLANACADCWPSAVDSFRVNGALRGLPVFGGTVLIYCNDLAFDRASRVRGHVIPLPDNDWTLDQFVALCRELTIDEDGDGRIDQFGFLQPDWVYYLPFIWAHGADLLDETRTRWVFTGPAALASLRFYRRLRFDWGVTPMPIEFAGQNADTAFFSGRVAMCVNGTWLEPFLRETRLAGRYCAVGIPHGPGGAPTRVTWDGLCVNASAPRSRQLLAARFAKFALGEYAQQVIAAHQRAVPARRCAADAFRRAGNPRVTDQFIASLADARMQPISVHWTAMDRALKRAFSDLLVPGSSSTTTPTTVLHRLAADPDIVDSFRTTK